jgi:decaprenyl-phosphate phosphoribosyltransferase
MFQLLRVHQYIKNLFVFTPLFFSFDFSGTKFTEVLIVFVLFSLLASSVYIFNDLMDIEEDKQHPEKRLRPLASGKVSQKIAILMIVLISLSTFIVAFVFNETLFFILLFYFILNIAYSLRLKHIAIVDIFIIAIGFVLRVFAGASVLEEPLSMWIIIMTFLLALFLALAKRRDDILLAKEGKQVRKNIDGYNEAFINTAMTLMAGVVIVAYILYTVSTSVMQRFETEYLYLATFFVILGILRYMQITFVEEQSGSPTKMVLKDKFLQLTIIGWLVSFIVIVN